MAMISIRRKLTFILMAIAFSATLSISAVVLYFFKVTIEKDAKSHLTSVASMQKNRIETLIRYSFDKAQQVASRTALRRHLKQYLADANQADLASMIHILNDAKNATRNYQKISILDLQGKVIASTQPKDIGLIFDAFRPDQIFHTSNYKPIGVDDDGILQVREYVYLQMDQNKLGILLIESNAEDLARIAQDYAGLGQTGETLIAEKLSNTSARFLTPLRFDEQATLKEVDEEEYKRLPILEALQGRQGIHFDLVDYRYKEVFAFLTTMQSPNWAIIVKFDKDEAVSAYQKLELMVIFSVLILLIIAYLIARKLSRNFTAPLNHLAGIANSISQGKWKVSFDGLSQKTSDKETHDLVLAFTDMTQELIEIFNSSTNGLVLIDRSGRMMHVNSSLQAMFGYSENELLQQSIDMLVPDQLRDKHVQLRKGYLNDIKTRKMGELRNIHGRKKSGELFPLEVGLSRIQTSSEIMVLASVIDISHIKSAQIKAEQASKAKSEFLANISHEIRTPLHAVLSQLQLLKMTQLDEVQKQHIDQAKKSSRVLLELLNDVLDISKIEAGKLDIEDRVFDCKKLLANVNSLMNVFSIDKNLELHFDIDENIPKYLKGDRLRINQILVNLVGNAIKFTKDGYVKLSAKMQSQTEDHCLIRFTVEDTGIGIEQDKIDKVLEKFTQAESSITRQFGGSGLGLSISASLIDLMGGHLGIESAVNKGSSFSFELKFAQVNRDDLNKFLLDEDRFAESDVEQDLLKGINILLVEDNEAIRISTAELLENLSASVIMAVNGQQAIETVKSNQDIDIVLMDLQMPLKDGYQASIEIREFADADTLPIIAMTAHSTIDEKNKALNLGMDDYLIKPADLSEIAHCILLHLGRISLNKGQKYEGASRSLTLKDNAYQLEGYDIPGALQRMNNSHDIYISTTKRFLEGLSALPEELSPLVSAQDFKAISKMFHKFKGGASIVGATKLRDFMKEHEESFNQHMPENSKQILAQLDDLCRETLAQFESVLIALEKH